ncbi:BTAD domain-containing putative transcriptional regulator [Nocardiopsis changdeensis]|uniref:Winged helix-turn-helix domain-containing protein n=1 Tax=Nocardiopsis changdeensis TaxID=2831969 RepID=A0ABX8BVC2_9ACTN|nr:MULTISPECIES: BTAD domain-containing putative transcriptional regulator [Nocardiopsis]QUX25154.1 winged helix-turn-helix domain-containing protein [Nocardiopsis changdeensis]QYX35541.1 winged helix-turn-helix domain-containing protein [Nocardiopsis sp. MT53]
MRFRLLGPLAVETTDGRPVQVPELKVRRLLAVLLTGEGRAIPADRLIDELWGDTPPARPLPALRAKVSQLRRAFDEAEPGGRDLVVSMASGYRLAVGPDDTDTDRFRQLMERARATGEPRMRSVLLSDALALWRGPALADFADEPFARPVVANLEEQRLSALEEHAQTRLDLGEHHRLIGDLAALVDEHPLRERARALHMLALYRSGRGSEALESYADVDRLLREELGLDPGVELVTLHQRILTQDPALLPSDARSDTPRRRSNLTAPVSDLIGRADLIERLREVVRAERLVTLTGPGGIGKSRLALELARSMVDVFPAGVWSVEAEAGRSANPGGESSAARVVQAIADSLELRDPLPAGAGEDLFHRVADALRPSRALLVLDGCERVLDGVADLVERLLGEVPELHVLTTSQEPLGIVGEWLHVVPPLEVPDPGTDAAAARTAGAVELFVRRAAASSPGFELTDDNVGPVTAICHRLDGVPLALELAATRVRGLGVHMVAERLDDRFRLLTGSPRRTPARQRTLRATMDWSWDLLSAAERRVLRRLAVHADGCALAGAEAVCAGPDVSADEVVDVLGRLISRSLVVMTEEETGPRYRLLESVALYCDERLAEAGEDGEVAARHARYYTELAERASSFLYGPEQRTWLRRLDTETANLRLALDTARLTGEGDLLLRLVRAQLWYWYLRGRIQECRRALDAVLSGPGPLPPGVRERMSVWADGLAVLSGAGPEPAALVHESLAACERVSGPVDAARARWFVSIVLFTVGENGLGAELVEPALVDFRAHGDRWGAAAVLAQRTWFSLVAGDYTAAARDGEQSMALFTELGDRWGQVQAGDALATLAEALGDHASAERRHREGLRVAEELGLWHDVSWKLSGLGRAALLTGDHAAAREYHLRAVRVAEEHSDRAGLIYAEIGLALGARREGALDEAEHRLSGLHRRLDGQGGVVLAQVLSEWGFVAEARGDAGTALRRHREGWAVARREGDPRAMASALEGMAAACALAGRHAHTARLLGAAGALREGLGVAPPAAERADADRAGQAAVAALGADAVEREMGAGAESDPEDLVARAAGPGAPGDAAP